MDSVIHVLSDAVANQIAAGEVIQRPASVVKELVENAIDAGATHVDIVVKNAGRTLIQVSDDGKGMNAEDALRCFGRHATSKISSVDDLFQLHTKGFRGEALSSIAAVAHVELNTRPEGSETGTHIYMEGPECRENVPCACAKGTTFIVKNLFFNVPARRNFLKSDNVEFNHIQDEFLRIALTSPDVAFTLRHNDRQVYNLPKSVLKQRIVNVFGNTYKEKLLPLQQESPVVRISGFIGKPSAARKTRGEQYLFVNNRYFKHAYFHHAITSAFEELLPDDHYPTYFIYFDIDPAKIDVNIHPTKIEIKFQEEKVVYPFLRSAVRHALGTFNISSTIDFENASPFDFSMVPTGKQVKPPGISYNPDYNPFKASSGKGASARSYPDAAPDPAPQLSDSWRQVYESLKEEVEDAPHTESPEVQLSLAAGGPADVVLSEMPETPFFQWEKSYIVCGRVPALLLVDQEAASERVMYERFLRRAEKKQSAPMQKLLFPESVTFSPQDAETVRDLLDEFKALGFDMEPFGKNVMIVHGVPSDMLDQAVQKVLEQLLETYKCNLMSSRLGRKDNLYRSLARTLCVKAGKPMKQEEMKGLLTELFSCEMSGISPGGRRTYVSFSPIDVQKLFKSKERP